jgi:hypothetical protein
LCKRVCADLTPRSDDRAPPRLTFLAADFDHAGDDAPDDTRHGRGVNQLTLSRNVPFRSQALPATARAIDEGRRSRPLRRQAQDHAKKQPSIFARRRFITRSVGPYPARRYCGGRRPRVGSRRPCCGGPMHVGPRGDLSGCSARRRASVREASLGTDRSRAQLRRKRLEPARHHWSAAPRSSSGRLASPIVSDKRRTIGSGSHERFVPSRFGSSSNDELRGSATSRRNPFGSDTYRNHEGHLAEATRRFQRDFLGQRSFCFRRKSLLPRGEGYHFPPRTAFTIASSSIGAHGLGRP